jgi:hypothetical protein
VSYEFTPADVRFLRSSAGVSAVAAVADLPLTSASHLADVATARRLVGDHAGPVLETVLLRRKAAAKVDAPQDWLFTGTALQQATPMPVARHRAARFTGLSVHDVTCSVGVDLAALAEVADRCAGSDLDEVRLAMAAHNVSAPLVRADALGPPRSSPTRPAGTRPAAAAGTRRTSCPRSTSWLPPTEAATWR